MLDSRVSSIYSEQPFLIKSAAVNSTKSNSKNAQEYIWRPVYTRVIIAGVSYIFLLWLFTTWWS